MKRYLLSNLVALDQLANALLCGSPDETLSSRAFRADRDGKVFGRIFRPVIDTIFCWEHRHCFSAYMAEINRRQLSENFR